MALANYSDLVAALSSWLNRADLESLYPTFIALFEARANRALRVPQMESEATSVGAATIALPDDCLALREVYVDTYLLRSMAPQDMREAYKNTTASIPEAYAIVGQTLVFAPELTSDTTVNLTYFASIPNLNSTDTTNWLMTANPDAYLYGVLAAAYDQIRDDAQRDAMLAVSDRILAEINAVGVKARLPAGPLIARGNVYNG